MSGIKGATVRNNLNKVVQIVRTDITASEEAAASAQAVGRTEFNQAVSSAQQAHSGLKRQLPTELREFWVGETVRWENLIRDHDKQFAAGQELSAQAEGRMQEFQCRKQKAENQLAQVTRDVNRVRQAIRGKDWYCDAENVEAKALRVQAERILSGMRQNVALGREAQALQRESLSQLAASEQLAQEADREYARLIQLAHDRQKRQQIKEEKERQAKNLQDDLVSLKKSIESKNFVKFGASVYTSAERRELDEVLRLIGNGRYESAVPRAETLRDKLAKAASLVDEAQRIWTTEKLAAERVIADAREELTQIDNEKLKAFSGTPAKEIDALYSEVSAAVGDLVAENFKSATQKTRTAVEKLRTLVEQAETNQRLSQERDEMAQAIMQALYDANFDTPEYYLKDDANSLSDLCVVAAAPGGVGDMKLRINLTGETKFEVCNIPEGHEQLCINQIHNLQRNLAESDIRFDMTDWGRAENQGKVHLDMRSRTKMVQKTIQRQG